MIAIEPSHEQSRLAAILDECSRLHDSLLSYMKLHSTGIFSTHPNSPYTNSPPLAILEPSVITPNFIV